MPDYIDLDLTADAAQLLQDAEDWLQAQAPPGYVIDPFVRWLLGAVTRMAVEDVVLAGQVPQTIFQTLGQNLLGVPALQATSATGIVTFTFGDTVGHTVPAGASVDIDDVPFITTSDAVAAPGASTATAAIMAVNAGTDANGLSGSADLRAPTYVFVDSVAVAGLTTGGNDGETGQEYVDRFADELPTFSAKAIMLEDFEAIARRDPSVGRALAIDNFVPPSTTGVEGAVTVAVHDLNGADLSGPAKTAIQATLEGSRVLNIDVHVINPTRTSIDVTFTVQARAGYLLADVEAAAEAAIAQFLSPATWGLPDGSADTWVDEPTLRRNDLIVALGRLDEVRHVTSLTLAKTGSTLGTADITLDQPAALTTPGAINGTATG